MNLSRHSRRRALQLGVCSSLTLPIASSPWAVAADPAASSVPPSEQIRIGVIGVGNRAKQLIDQLPSPAAVVAVADCYRRRMEDARVAASADWTMYDDYRQMIDREQLDGVIVATPDHGRTLPCMIACQNGLDVYAEKPLTAYVSEGRELVKVARRENRIFQVGTQQRTMEINDHCCRLVREGQLGKVKLVQAFNYTGPKPYESLPEEPIPEGDDWDTWCGPTPLRPFNSNLQFAWMQWRDYSGGEMTNWGAHGVDQIQWALGKSLTGPTQLWPVSEGPDGKVSMRYADGVEVRFELDKGPQGGAIFNCEKGKLEINRNRYACNPADLVTDAPNPAVADKWELPGWIAGPHLANWIECMGSRELPNADIEIGHRSITVCHLVNITRQLGRKLNWNPDLETFPNDPEANDLLTRHRRPGYELPS